MTFPDTPLPVTVELNLNGTWTDISSDVYERDAIRITRGRSDWGRVVDPTRCQFTLRNHTGNYSPRNPRGAHFGLIGRNTPVRVSVEAGTPALCITGESQRITTPDHASLDITGDIDVRCEAQLVDWAPPDRTLLMGKYGETANGTAGWLLMVQTGRIFFAWSTTGFDYIQRNSNASMAVPPSGRLAVRATLDVNNGASGHTLRFYTADTIAGPWTQLGDPVVTSGTTSIFANSASLDVGDVNALNFPSPLGLVLKAEVRTGINGTVVANPDFTSQSNNATSFTDAVGRTWTVANGAKISNRKTRFLGEISTWPIRWGTGGHDVYVPVEASGIMRRLGQGAAPLQSTLRRRIPSDPNLIAYWPMEEGDNATLAYSPLAGVRPMATTSGVDYGQSNTLAGSSPLPTLNSKAGALPRFVGTVPAKSTGQFRVEFVYRHDNAPASHFTYMRILTTGTIREWYLQMSATGGRIIGLNADSEEVVNQAASWTDGPFNAWYRMVFYASQSGGTVNYKLLWVQIGDASGSITGSATANLGRVTGVGSPPGGYSENLDGLALGHLAVFAVESSTIFNYADHGYSEELAGARLNRLRAEESLPLTVSGSAADTELMGPQRPDAIMALLQEVADVDGGILYEARDALSLAYRSRTTLYNQPVRLTLDYAGDDGLITPLDPVDDDQHVRNDIIVTRTNGGSGRVVATDGPLSTLAPPAGVGRYDDAITLNLAADEQTEQHAAWRLHLGTWDEARYPQVSLLLQAAPGLLAEAAAVDVGDRMQIVNPPSWLPPEAIDLHIQGYSELLHQGRWEMQFTCTPAGPWTVGVVEDAVLGRADTDGSQLAQAVTAGATALPVRVTAGPHWITSADYPTEFPFDVTLGGEVATVTAIRGTIQDQFGRTVSNGWGTADSGQTWTTEGGSAADYSVGSGTGRHSIATKNVFRSTVLTGAGADVDLRADFSLSQAPTGNSCYVYACLRRIDDTHMYFARVQVSESGAMYLTVRKRNGAETELGTPFTAPYAHTAGTWYSLRIAATGSTLTAKVWPRSSAEPDEWHVTTTDSDFTAAGAVALRTFLPTAATNTLPLVVSFDNTWCTPQIMTVTRAVNGISKGHGAGANIRLTHPTLTAL